jgi:hypothetical protein
MSVKSPTESSTTTFTGKEIMHGKGVSEHLKALASYTQAVGSTIFQCFCCIQEPDGYSCNYSFTWYNRVPDEEAPN